MCFHTSMHSFITQCYGRIRSKQTHRNCSLPQAPLAWTHFLHNADVDEKRNLHVSLQPAVIANISKSSLWWLRGDAAFSRVVGVTQQQLTSFAVRAAGPAARVCWSAALLLEVEPLTSHQSEGAVAPRLAGGLPDKRTCRLTWCFIIVANGMVNLRPFTSTMMTCFLFPLLSCRQTWLQRGLWGQRMERSWRR